jgi:tetratricopeptide (TPR) repeat protein
LVTLHLRSAPAKRPLRRHRTRGGPSASRTADFLADAASALAQGRNDLAVEKLSSAAALEPADAKLRSDLAAVRLQRNALRGDPHELSLALGDADRAAAAAPALPAARHNLALALELVGLPEQALREWRALLRLERDPRWWREAKRHEVTLSRMVASAAEPPTRRELRAAVERGSLESIRALVSRSPQACREYLEEELLEAWADAVLKGDPAAAHRLLAGARSIATALAWTHHETMLADVFADLRRGAANPATRAELARTFNAYGRARSAMEGGDFSGALPDLQLARDRLLALDNPFALRAEVEIAACRFQRSEYATVEPLLRALAAKARRRHYCALEGRCLWLLGVLAGVAGNPTASLAPLNAALRDFQTLGEAGNAAHMRTFLAEAYDLLGQPAQAWRALGPALADEAAAADPAARFYALYVASWLAIEDGNPGLASRFQQETLRLARADARPQALVTALERQALVDSLLEHPEAALSSLEQAAVEQHKVGDATVRRILSGDIELLRGELLSRRAPQEAQPSFDRAVEIFRSTSFHYRIARALYERARNELTAGQDDAGERDLKAAIAESEHQRAQVQPLEQRIAYLNQTRSLFETMIAFELDHRRLADALGSSEAIKARVLLDWILVSPRSPNNVQIQSPAEPQPPIARLRRAIPRGVVVIEYAALGNRLAIFVLHSARLNVATVPVDPTRLAGLAGRSAGGAKLDDRLLEELHELLIRPVAASLRPGDRLVFVPDGALHAIPFAALRDRRTQRYLVQDHATSIAPSLEVYVTNTRRDAELAARPGMRALVVADPAFDPELFPDLGRLRAASAEESIARAFAGSRSLSDQAATPAAFLRAAPAYQILHFAGHALVNPEFPLFSKLLFAASPGDPARGVLYSGEFLGRRLPNTRLVVLASCSTGAGRISGTEGVESIARTLLATGIPTVVASLWNVSDATTGVFMRCFYRHLAASYDVAGALQAAQLELLAQGDPTLSSPEVWAAFVAAGGT